MIWMVNGLSPATMVTAPNAFGISRQGPIAGSHILAITPGSRNRWPGCLALHCKPVR